MKSLKADLISKNSAIRFIAVLFGSIAVVTAVAVFCWVTIQLAPTVLAFTSSRYERLRHALAPVCARRVAPVKPLAVTESAAASALVDQSAPDAPTPSVASASAAAVSPPASLTTGRIMFYEESGYAKEIARREEVIEQVRREFPKLSSEERACIAQERFGKLRCQLLSA